VEKLGNNLKFVCKYKDKVLGMLGRRRYRNFLQKSSLKKRKGVFGKLKAAAQFAKDLSGKLKNMKGVIGKFQKNSTTSP